MARGYDVAGKFEWQSIGSVGVSPGTQSIDETSILWPGEDTPRAAGHAPSDRYPLPLPPALPAPELMPEDIGAEIIVLIGVLIVALIGVLVK